MDALDKVMVCIRVPFPTLVPLRLVRRLRLMEFERAQTRTRDFCFMSYYNVLLQSYYVSTKYKCDRHCTIRSLLRIVY